MSPEEPLHPTSLNPHRALMTFCLLVSGFVVFGLFAGWQWYFQHKERRDAILRFAEKQESKSRQENSGFSGNPAPPSATSAANPADGSPRVSLSDMVKAGSSGSEGDVPAEPVIITLPLDASAPDVQQADDSLQKFWRATNWQDKASFVFEPEHTRPLMEHFYTRQKGADPVSGALLNRGHFRLNGTEILHFTYSCNRPGDVLELAMRRGADGRFVLDWESYVGFSEMAWQDFKRERPTTPLVFRAFASLSDYYNYEFSDKNRFVSVNLLSPDGLVSLHGYCERKSAIGAAITRSLGRTNAMTGIAIKLAFPDNAESDHCVWIKQFISDRWLLLP